MKRLLTLACAAALTCGFASAQDEKAAKGDAAKGKETFEMCAACHAVDSDEKKMGPSLKGLFTRDKLKNGQKPTDAAVMKIVNEGGNGMPGYADLLSAEEKANVLAFLKTL